MMQTMKCLRDPFSVTLLALTKHDDGINFENPFYRRGFSVGCFVEEV
jgi:hypothetical protein